MSKLKLSTKLFVTYIAAGIIPVILICIWNYYKDNQGIDKMVQDSITNAQTVVNDSLAAHGRYVTLAGRQVSANPNFIAAIEADDAPALVTLGKRLMEEAGG